MVSDDMADAPLDTRPEQPRPFSMLRTFVAADFITLGNGFCGAGSILALMQYMATHDRDYLWAAMALLPIALVLDFADGRVARYRHRSSTLGADLDSLADVISFGMAPATLGFAVGMRGALDVAILLYFVACGISRLARFNVTSANMSDDTGKVKYFEGTPIPTSVLIVGLFAWFTRAGHIDGALPFGTWTLFGLEGHPLALIYALSGSLMISTVRIPKI